MLSLLADGLDAVVTVEKVETRVLLEDPVGEVSIDPGPLISELGGLVAWEVPELDDPGCAVELA